MDPEVNDSQAPEPSDEAANQAKRASIERAFLIKAAQEQCLAPEDALRLADLDAIEINEAGKVSGVDACFQALRSKRPYLFRVTQTPGLDQAPRHAPAPSDQLAASAKASGLTRDIHLWRQATRR